MKVLLEAEAPEVEVAIVEEVKISFSCNKFFFRLLPKSLKFFGIFKIIWRGREAFFGPLSILYGSEAISANARLILLPFIVPFFTILIKDLLSGRQFFCH